MKYYKVKFKDGTFKILKAKNALSLIEKYDLATKKHINTTIHELEGEQLAITISNNQ